MDSSVLRGLLRAPGCWFWSPDDSSETGNEGQPGFRYVCTFRLVLKRDRDWWREKGKGEKRFIDFIDYN